MIDRYEKKKDLYEKKTDWAAIFGLIFVIGFGILVLAAQ